VGVGHSVAGEFRYVGAELDLFAAVHNWKSYWSRYIARYIAGDVLEVGAGIGSNTRYLHRDGGRRWVCLEPDDTLARQMRQHVPAECEVVCATVQDAGGEFDTILYIDVLEHIEDDSGELRAASRRLRPGGRVIVLSPAHQSLFTAFDQAIGHYRRYDRRMLSGITPRDLEVERIAYLDSTGLAASLANRLLLRQSMPTERQLAVWDRWMIPVSRWVDPLLGYSVGKTIVGIWRKPL